jgi:hypothetical protein
MANPNIVNVTNIVAGNAFVALSSTSATLVASNPSASGKVYKINSLIVSNVDGSVPHDISISVYSAASLGGTETEIISAITIPSGASLIAIDKTTSIYLTENQSLGAQASAADKFKIVASWEEIS